LTSQYLVIHNPSAAFYLPQSRIFQFAIGAILVYWPKHKVGNEVSNELVLIVGLAMIFYSVFYFSEQTDFPGFNALIPSVGAALMILGGRSKYLGEALSSRAFVFTGKISYSLYLWHWPILVFYLYAISPELKIGTQFTLLILCYLLGYLSYRYVEIPFRKKREKYVYLNGAKFGLTFCLLLLPVLFVSSNIWANEGWKFRFGSADREALDQLYSVDQLRVNTTEYSEENFLSLDFRAEGDKKTVLVIGDSHARDIANAMHLSLPKSDYEIRMLPFDDRCIYTLSDEMSQIKKSDQQYCLKKTRALDQSKKIPDADLVLISQAWTRNTAKRSSYLVRKISGVAKKSSQEIVVLGRSPDFFNFQNLAIKLISQGKTRDQINAIAFKKVRAANNTDKILERLSKKNGYNFVSKLPLVCHSDKCYFFTPEGHLTLYDANHWTLAGSRFFGKRLTEKLFEPI